MFWIACKVFFFMTLLLGCIYSFLITGIATIAMPYQAHGSLVYSDGKLRGSELIVQPFTGEQYFWPRPSALNYNTLRSYGSNLGPTNRELKKQVEQRAQRLAESHATHSLSLPVDMLYASGSGLDPHISVESAYFQIERVARTRALSPQEEEKLRHLIDENIEGKTGLLGPRHINVFLLNKQLDQKK